MKEQVGHDCAVLQHEYDDRSAAYRVGRRFAYSRTCTNQVGSLADRSVPDGGLVTLFYE
jgi:hypothetical protein